MRLHRFHGGLSLPGHKAESAAGPIQACPLPGRLAVPLLQHAGSPALPCVAPGQRVRAGDVIGRGDGPLSSVVHAPADGTVLALEARALAQPPGLDALHAVIECDPVQAGLHCMPPLDPATTTPDELLARIAEAGIVGLGGAGFPTAAKAAVCRDTLILNGAECEPWIACDDRLLRERADEVVAGGAILRRITGARRVLLAIEDRMPEALQAAADALVVRPDAGIDRVTVPTVYPEGGERQLIQVLTGLEVPRGGLPRDIGVLVQNVATAAAVWRAVVLGEPVTRRIVTVTGPGVVRPGNYEVTLGTAISDLVSAAGGYTDQAARLLLGGPMMGQALPHDGFAITKTSSCVLVLGEADLRAEGTEMPCIRCGDCATACPARLQPQQLLWAIRAGRWDQAEALGTRDCIECGCCDLVCPSHIPLTQHFRFAKGELRHRQRSAIEAAAAKARFETRQARLERDAAERAAREAARRQAVASGDAVAEAIARARAMKRERGTGNGEREEQ